MKRWVGLGVIADNLINIGKAMAKWRLINTYCKTPGGLRRGFVVFGLPDSQAARRLLAKSDFCA